MLLQQKVISYMCPPYNILWYNVKICYYKKKLYQYMCPQYNILWYNVKICYYNKKWYHICVLNITYYDIMLKYVITTKSDIISVSSI